MRTVDRARTRRRFAALIALSLVLSCDDNGSPTSPAVDTGDLIVLSDTAAPPLAAAVAIAHAGEPASAGVRALSTAGEVAYIALPPGTAMNGVEAFIWNERTGSGMTVPVIDGGFDPIAVPARIGDPLEVEVRGADGATIHRIERKVPDKRRPRVVRTRPPRGKRDVALNATIIVVFSEPIDARTLTASSVRIARGGTPVSGHLEFQDAERLTVAFIPAEPLVAAAEYELTVTQDVRDLDGEALETAVAVTFSTVGPSNVLSQIAFWSGGIRVANADGTGGRNITTGLTDYQPAWSADGSQIAFASDRFGEPFDHDIVVVNADGSNVRRLTSGPDHDSAPAWSPDGTKLAFIRGELTGTEWHGFVFVMNADGSGATRLEPASGDTWEGGAAGGPTWSPDGSKIAFARHDELLGYDVWVMNADGSGVTRLTSSPADELQPAWSPAGDAIAFASDREGSFEIYVMKPDGSDVVRLTDGPGSTQNLDPSWSPDGSMIAFFGLGGVAIMNATGSQVRRVADGNTPAWSPAGSMPTNPPLSVQVVSRSVNSGIVLGALAEPLRVKVLSGGVPVAGTRVSWKLPDYGGGTSLSPYASFTDASGVAETNVTFGPTSGTYFVEAAVPDAPESPIGFVLTAVPDVVASLVPVSSDNQVGVRGSPLKNLVQVAAVDRHGNVLEGTAIRWEIVSGDELLPLAGNDAWVRWTLRPEAGPQFLKASLVIDPTGPSFTFTAVAVDAVVDVGWTDVGDCHTGFGPADLTVPVGTVVGWGWTPCDADGDGNGLLHNVTFEDDPASPTSSANKNTGSHVRAFSAAGTYRYRCTLHSTSYTSGESGVVIVSP
jgi:Tol biopolymer transport system component/plastocyanin